MTNETKKAFLIEESGKIHSLDELASRATDGAISVGRVGKGAMLEIAADMSPVIALMISKHHANIVKREDGFYIQDNKSTNGTRVNNHRLNGEYVKLENEDRLFFERYSVVYEER